MTSRRQSKAERRFIEAVTQFVLSLGGRPGSFYDYELDTPAGLLNVSVHDNWVATRFDDVAMGRAFSEAYDRACNPYSGKWNFHFPSGYTPELAVAELRFWFDKLMSWRPSS
ncbi:MAG: hypothetical protein RBS80_08820 [Thermoguttaceae bacterium]|jgi:hypothetical protein|nr:hypothetical protein [Thermoguttaceae bacterium]